MTVNTIKVFGERNTGTNFLEDLLRQNSTSHVINGNVHPSVRWFFSNLERRLNPETYYYVAEPLRDFLFICLLWQYYGWKHTQLTETLIRKIPPNIAIIALTKDPYAWLLSLYKNSYHRQPKYKQSGESFSQFIRTPWSTVKREQSVNQFTNPVKLWSAKVQSYQLLLTRENSAICQYENLIDNIPQCLTSLAKTCGFALNADTSIPEQSAKGDSRRSSDIIDYYKNRAFLKDILPEDITFINEQLNPDAMELAGYKYI